MAANLLLLTTFVLLASCRVSAIPLENFYLFGSDVGDTLLHRNDDDSSNDITLRAFNFFGRMFSSIYVNNNGNISPGESLSSHTPSSELMLPADFSIIAVYWADVDTGPLNGGFVWYRETTSLDLLQRALTDIQHAYPLVTSIDYLFISTWDHVGFYDDRTDKTNTFQCVLAVSGDQTYVIYLYADGLIQWTTGDAGDGIDGLGGDEALVGYNAGDGIISYTIPGSQTDAIIGVASVSNVGIPGMLVFRLDEDQVVFPSCSDNFLALTLSPRFGNMLGGTPVTVGGPCFEPSDVVTCLFDDISTPGIFVNQDSVVCISPALSTVGRVEVILEVIKSNEVVSFQGNGFFYSISIFTGHAVRIQSSIMIESRTAIEVTWNPAAVFPLADNPNSFSVDVLVYAYVYPDMEWELQFTERNFENNGHAILKPTPFRENKVRATCIHVAVGEYTRNDCLRDLLDSTDIPFPSRAGIWSGLLFSIDTEIEEKEEKAREIRNKVFDEACSTWIDQMSEMIQDDELNSLPACPPTQDRARLPNSGLEEVIYESVLSNTNYHNQWMKVFHPEASRCFAQAIVTSGDPGQECCYNSTSHLIVGSQSGGSVNRYAPVDFCSLHKHIEHDLIPNVFCCPRTCNMYYKKRPSDDSSRFVPPLPACIYGDPHVITLDGLRYTFNGKGEFTLIETANNTFSLQGRMVEVDVNPGLFFGAAAPATVFSAIAGKQNDSGTVQFTLETNNATTVTIDGEVVDFEMLSEQTILNVMVMDKGNSTYAAAFSSGVYIEVQSANGFISLLLTSLPKTFMFKTSGLMGSFNSNAEDDLVPKYENGTRGPIPTNSTLEEIHYLFGLTWIISNPNESLFSYNESLGESWTYFYDPYYNPTFEPTFDDPLLEELAVDVCGDSLFCLFDIAATKRPEVGMTTAVDNENYDVVVNMSQPVVCFPPCENGACVATNTCSCSEGYIGDTCSTAVMTECEENVCESGGTCQMLAGSIICTCLPQLTGGRCELLLPPNIVNDAIADTPLISVPLIIHPNELGFKDYNQLISLCYEVRGIPRQIVNLISTKCTSVNARYARLGKDPTKTTFGTVAIRTVDSSGKCQNIQVNQACSVSYNRQVVSNNLTVGNISIILFADSITVSVPNCGREVVMKFYCLHHPTHDISVINMTITRNYIEQDITHGLIGQFWSADISSEVYEGDPEGLIPGYEPYTLTVMHPQDHTTRTFVGVLIPRLWNHDPGKCIYAGNSQGGSTLTGPSAPYDSVIEGDYHNYRLKSLFQVDFAYSKFNIHLCNDII